jgi:DNA modification methylase
MSKLTPDHRDRIISLLAQGLELPADDRNLLFPPEKREYELVYAGKERREDILAETLSVPFQEVRTFGTTSPANGRNPADPSTAGWRNQLIFGDNLQAMKHLLDQKRAGKLLNADGTNGVRLIYIDPPFATKQEFRGNQDQKAYNDKIAGAQFVEFLRRRLIMMHEILADDGSLYLHLDSRKVHYIKVVLDEIFGEAGFRNEVIWRRQSAHNDSRQCGSIHETLLFYSKNESKWIWNEVMTAPSSEYIEAFFDSVEEGTGRRYARGDLSAGGLSGGGYRYEYKGITHVWRCPITTLQRLDDQKRLHWPKKGVPRLKRYLDEFRGVSLQDVWTDIKVPHNLSEERINYPTQKPEALLNRIISASSNPGDIVFDGFMGSGTTPAVAEKLGRRWIGMDASKLAVYTTQKRLLNLRAEIGNKGAALEPRPFTLYNAGLYDFKSLKELPREAWRFFALQLFGCRDEPHHIGGVPLCKPTRTSLQMKSPLE